MFRLATNARTGIDLSDHSVVLVRAEGRRGVERFTHAGVEALEGAPADPVAAGAAALGRLLRRLGLKKRQLGQVAASLGGPETSCNQVDLPAMDDKELARALPFEARRHLELDGIDEPVVDYQVLSRDEDTGNPTPLRVVFAATSRGLRERRLAALDGAGIHPDVLDLDVLAGLNALLATQPDLGGPGRVAAQLHLGADRAVLQVWSRDGGLYTRQVGPGAPVGRTPDDHGDYCRALVPAVVETASFYRSRFRRDIDDIRLCGPGTADGDLTRLVGEVVPTTTRLMDPFAGADTPADLPGATSPAVFAIACGLCRWWDADRSRP